jgi:hypothetical protein
MSVSTKAAIHPGHLEASYFLPVACCALEAFTPAAAEENISLIPEREIHPIASTGSVPVG